MKMRILYVVIFIAVTSICVHAHAGDVLLGVLEDVPGEYAGENNSYKVRVLFSRQNSGWVAFKSNCEVSECLAVVTSEYPKEVAWFVGLDGRLLGKVRARTPGVFPFYGHICLQEIIDGKPPIVGKPSYEFSGLVGKEVHRPLVTATNPYFQDPASWKRIKSTPELNRQGVELLRDKAPALCKVGHSDAESLVVFQYGVNDVKLRIHRSKNGWLVMTINLKGAYYCKDGAGDGSFDTQSFAINPEGRVKYLGAGLTLLDAGDYDHDGYSEIVFSLSRYNRGGYVLFSDNFIEGARFEYSYH